MTRVRWLVMTVSLVVLGWSVWPVVSDAWRPKPCDHPRVQKCCMDPAAKGCQDPAWACREECRPPVCEVCEDCQECPSPCASPCPVVPACPQCPDATPRVIVRLCERVEVIGAKVIGGRDGKTDYRTLKGRKFWVVREVVPCDEVEVTPAAAVQGDL